MSARRVVAAVARRPHLWPAAARQGLVLARPGVRRYLRFRAVTQYGDPSHPMEPADVVAWLEWCSRQRPRRA